MLLSNHNFDLSFNPSPSTVMHIDLNSCFATIEQQANPKLRGKPIAVAAYASSNGCILAPSIEAKRFGVKTGMRVKDGKKLCPEMIVISPDPWKYRSVHLALRKLFADYTNDFHPKSIDEFVLNLEGYPAFRQGMFKTGQEIKERIRREIGEWLMVSIGIAPNRFLAKTAAGLKKPDGLEEINKDNYLEVYSKLRLTDLCGIALGNAARLSSVGVCNVLDFYKADIRTLKEGLRSVLGFDWYMRLRGWEVDNKEFVRRSYGNSYSLPKPLVTPEELAPILQKLVEKTGGRMRKAGYKARGIHLGILYRDRNYFHHGKKLVKEIFESREIYQEAYKIMCKSPYHTPVANLAVSCFDLKDSAEAQLELFSDVVKKEKLSKAIDGVNERWGEFVITPLRMLDTRSLVPDRIAFGGVKELEEFTIE